MRYERTVHPEELSGMLVGTATVPTENTGHLADLAKIDKAFKALVKSGKVRKTDYDVKLVELIHQVLKSLPIELLVDMRFWHWLAVERFQDLVWERWFGGRPVDMDLAVAPSAAKARFLGTRSLRGRNRNALSRLFFTAEILYDQKDGYRLATTAFANQDRHTSIFERELGLMPDAAKALIRTTAKMDSKRIQKTAMRLNHIGSTLVLEAASENQLIKLLK